MIDGLPSGGSLQPTPAAGTAAGNSPSLLPSSAEAMSGETLQRSVTIQNPLGFHLRPMTAFAQKAAQFQSTVTLIRDGQRVNGKSAWELMLLAAEQGTVLMVEVSGPDAIQALEALGAIIEAPSVDDEPDAPAPPKG